MERPRAVKQITSIFTLTGLFFSIVAMVLLLVIVMAPRLHEYVIVPIGLLFVAFLHGTLAYGFYNLRSWSYTPTKYLVRLNSITAWSELPKEIETSEVREIFQVDKSGDNESTHQGG